MATLARRFSLGTLLALTSLLAPVMTARAADTLTVDFETGPALNTPVTNEYLGSHFLQFFKDDPGFRPYRRSVPLGMAHSGTVVADVGGSVCYPGEVSDPISCEFPAVGTNGRLTRTATTVTLYAGLFTDPGGPVSAQLTALDAFGNALATGSAVPIDQFGFDTPVSVTRPTGDIAGFALRLVGGSGQTLGFDDLTLEYPDNSLPEISLVAPPGPISVLQGATVDLPISIVRLNGSNGLLDLSVEGLPAGVTAQLLPDPVPGTEGAATLRLTASDTAPPFFVPANLTLTADPNLNAMVAPGPRTATIPITVRSNFSLTQSTPGAVAIPQCAPADTTLRLNRDIAFATSKTVTLTAEGLPAGVSAEFLPSATVPPGGGLIAEPRLRLRRGTAGVPSGSSVLVRAVSPGAPQRTLSIPLANAAPTASLDSTTTSGAVPSRLQPGSRIRMVGNGFCSGTKVRVGNALAETDAEVEPEGTALAFRLPRLATSGVVTVVPPAGANTYGSTGTIVVRSPRNHTGFPFDNPTYDNLSLTELAELVGFDEMFVRVNPCWPIYDCSIPTGLPDPVAYLKWQIIEQVMQESGGHCFGINRTIQELGAGRIGLNRFASGLTRNFDMPSAAGPISAFESYLDHRHAGQATGEFLLAYGQRSDSISSQLSRIRNELTAGRLPGVIVHNSFTEGHVITAHDVETLADGRTIIHTYDNERPFLPGEDTDTSGETHRSRESGSQVVINAAKSRWDYSGWSGGNDGSLYATRLSDFPADPSLPGLGEAIVGIFGSDGGAAVTSGEATGAEVVPVLDRNATPGAAGFLVGKRGAKAIGHVVKGKKQGSYSQLITGRGFVGSVNGVRTGRGVVDRISGTPGARLLRFAGERPRRLTLNVGVQAGKARRSATIRTGAAAGGSDSAQLAGGRSLVYEHDGAPTTYSFALSSAEPGAAAGRFESGSLTVRDGDRVVATPVSWRSPSAVKLSIRRADGRRETRRLRNRAAGPSARISVTRLRVKTARGHKVAQVTARLRRLRGRAVEGVVLRLTRGGKTVARRGFGVRRPRNGARTFSWRLPARLARGGYVLVADVMVASMGAQSGTRRLTRRASLRL